MTFIASAGEDRVCLIEAGTKKVAEDFAKIYFSNNTKISVVPAYDDDIGWFKVMGIKTFKA